MKKFIIACIISIGVIAYISNENTQSIEGTYHNQGKGIYKAMEFKGSSTVLIHSLGMKFACEYSMDGDLIRVKTDKTDLLFQIEDEYTIVGEGFAKGTYIK